MNRNSVLTGHGTAVVLLVLVGVFAMGLSCGVWRSLAADVVEVFGSEDLGTASGGFVFMDGGYIDPPYTFTRTGVVIYVNGLPYHDYGIGEWPLPGPTDPGPVPDGISSNSTFDDLYDEGKDRYDWKQIRYIEETGGSNTIPLILEMYSSIPFVASASVGSQNEIVIETLDGATDIVWRARGATKELSTNGILADLRLLTSNLIVSLDQGATTFGSTSNDVNFNMTPGETATNLSLMADIFDSELGDAEKIDAMQKLGLWGLEVTTNSGLLEIADLFEMSSNGVDRLNALMAAQGVVPKTTNDIPENLPVLAERMLVVTSSGDGEAGGTGSYTNGAKVNITAAAGGNSVFVHWSGDVPTGSDTNSPSMSVVMDCDRQISAHFAVKMWKIQVTFEGDGAVISRELGKVDGDVPIINGADMVFDMVPGEGNSVKDVLIDGVTVGDIIQHLFQSVTSDHTLHVEFAP